MKKYKVNVNGQMYEITVEECDVNEVPTTTAPAAPVAPVAPVAAPAAPAAPAAAPSGEGEPVSCPMPGTIRAVNVSNGAQVKKGDVLFVFEAMKMENEICASRDGVISDVNVTRGAAVDSGAVLCLLK